MSDAAQIYSALFKAASETEVVRDAVKLAGWKAPLLAAGLAGAGGYGLGYLGEQAALEEAEKKRQSTRNLSFGAGLASGLIAPQLLKGLGGGVFGATPGGEFMSI
jgi:hypothetical protein